MGEKVCPLLMVKADTLEDARCIEDACAWYCNKYSDPSYECAVADIAENLRAMIP